MSEMFQVQILLYKINSTLYIITIIYSNKSTYQYMLAIYTIPLPAHNNYSSIHAGALKAKCKANTTNHAYIRILIKL